MFEHMFHERQRLCPRCAVRSGGMFGAWEGQEIATFWIAIGGVILGVSSLGWQAWTWKHSGAIVRVTATQTLPLYDTVAGQRPGEWHVAVTARNTGRGPATVTGWGFRTPDGHDIIAMRPLSWSSPIPFPIPPGGQEGSWHMETDEVKASCQREGQDFRALRGWVRLSDGRQVFAKRRGIGLK